MRRLSLFIVAPLCVVAVIAAAPPLHVRPPGTYSQVHLRSVMDRILDKNAGAAWERATHSALGFVGVDGDRVQVGLPAITPAVRAAARRAFGSAVSLTVSRGVILPPPVRIDHVVKLHGPDTSGAGGVRDNDTAPFYGGDAIVATTVYQGVEYADECTSSFDAYDTHSNANVMITDGHCSLGGFTKFYSGYLSGNTLVENTYEGSAALVEFTKHEPDAMVITKSKLGTYEDRVYYGIANRHESYHVRGQAGVGKGGKICTDGFVTGRIQCGAVIAHWGYYVNVSAELPGGRSESQMIGPEYITTGTKVYCQHGDSGGPVSLDEGRQMTAVGTIEALITGKPDDCVINEIATVLSSMSVQLVTGG